MTRSGRAHWDPPVRWGLPSGYPSPETQPSKTAPSPLTNMPPVPASSNTPLAPRKRPPAALPGRNCCVLDLCALPSVLDPDGWPPSIGRATGTSSRARPFGNCARRRGPADRLNRHPKAPRLPTDLPPLAPAKCPDDEVPHRRFHRRAYRPDSLDSRPGLLVTLPRPQGGRRSWQGPRAVPSSSA